MPHFFYKLVPPRSTFPADITAAEGAIKQEHFAYWSRVIGQGRAAAYGPVMDPVGMYGIVVLEVEDENVAKDIAANDPAISANAGFSFELFQMPDAVVRS